MKRIAVIVNDDDDDRRRASAVSARGPTLTHSGSMATSQKLPDVIIVDVQSFEKKRALLIAGGATNLQVRPPALSRPKES